MSWPLASHFSAMLQHPRAAFRDPRLQACQVEKDALGQPRPWSGAFAVVYKGIYSDTREPLAIRVFTTESPERHERYDAISDYLRSLSSPQRCLVHFEYRDAGIRSASDGKWYPLILMDWVEGETLFQWVRARCQAGDDTALAQASQSWVRVVRELSEAQIAHGDLQPGNVMITSTGAIKLVDYDSMGVPVLFGRRNLEVGVEPYQHPQRDEKTLLTPHLDNYSALVIYVALRALAADPRLWARYVDRPGHERLLFRKEDLRSPTGSPLCYELKHSPDGELSQLLDRLLEMTSAPLDRIPPLWQLTDGYSQVEQLLGQKRWKEAVKLLNRRGRFRDAPEHLRPLIKQAYEHVCREEAWEALAAVGQEINEDGDRQLVLAWNEAVFVGFPPAEAQRSRVVAARQRVRVLDTLASLAAEDTPATIDWIREQAMAHWAAQLPAGYAHRLAARANLAVDRVQAMVELETSLEDPVDEAALVRAWQGVVQAECSSLVSSEWLTRIELAQQRAPLLQDLAGLSDALPPDQFDRRILALWRPELLDDCAQADCWREAHQRAIRRKETLRQLQAAVEAGNSQAILQAMSDPCLAEYPLPASWNSAIRAASDLIERTTALADLLQHGRREGFLTMFDARLIRQYPSRFESYHERLIDWVCAEVLPLDALGLEPAIGRASLVRLDDPSDSYRLRWTWPLARFCDECVAAVCREPPTADDDQLSHPALHRMVIDRRAWESGGGSHILFTEPQWHGCWVAVWARVDLGFVSLFSHPLVLGRLECLRGLRGLLSRWWSKTPPRKASGGPPRG